MKHNLHQDAANQDHAAAVAVGTGTYAKLLLWHKMQEVQRRPTGAGPQGSLQ